MSYFARLAGMPRAIGMVAIAVFVLACPVLAPSIAGAAGVPPITVAFDHLSTGFELDGVHRDLPCESCHLNAVFKGTPRNCGVCHITGSTFNATPKVRTHIPSTNDCAACHDTLSFRPAVHFDHHEVMGNCVSCHNGTVAQGKGPTHPATSLVCEACHTTMSWNPPKAVDHTQIPLAVQGFCIICHNGVQAAGKPKNHIGTNLECGDCHLTANWLGATYDHTGIVSNCVSCHDGIKAVGKQGNHMPTSTVCESCHTTGLGTKTPSWAPSAFLHTQMTVATCQTCHSGTVKITTGFVSGQPSNHVPPIPSIIDCGVCHGNTPAAETWAVLAASISTLHSGLNVKNCLMCHAGQTFAGVPAPYVPMSISGISPLKKAPLAPPHIPVLVGSDCSACHGQAYALGGFGPATAMNAAKHAFVSASCDTCHDTGRNFYVGSGTPLQRRPADHVNATDLRLRTEDCSLCHETTDWNSTAMPVGHMPNPGNLPCATCHTKAPNDYTLATLAANAVLHTGVSGNCGLCHGNYVTALTWANNYTPKNAILTPSHIPYLVGTDCSSCHSSTTYAIGGFSATAMSPAKHAFVPSTCDTCHEAKLIFYVGALTLTGRPGNHTTGQMMAPNDCSACHNTGSWTTMALPAGHMPNPGAQVCTVCHTAAPANYTTFASIAVLHTGISAGCAQCHGTTQLTFYNYQYNPKSAVLNPPHIPILALTDCGSCHAANYAAGGFGPMNMTQAKHAFVAVGCVTCHEAGRSFTMGAASPALQGRPADHTTGQMVAPNDCGACHSTANWNTTALPAGHMPNPGNQGCTVCHTGAPSTYKTLAANATLHTGIGRGCLTCHGAPNAAPFVFYLNYTPKPASGLAPPHIPSGLTICESCHTITFTTFSGTTMSSSKHTQLLANTGGTCDQCHDIGKAFYGVHNLTVRPSPNHHSGQDCKNCHSTNDWGGNSAKKAAATAPAAAKTTIGLVVNTGMASRRQSGAPDPGNPLRNGTPGGGIVRMSHAGVVGNCAGCHNGVLAAGKGAGHVASNMACENCHTPFAWLPARFEHRGVTARCAGCHNGALASGIPTRHVVTVQDCSACHGTLSWQSATFSHLGLTATCQSCHNGITATGKQLQHVSTTLDCSSCHSTAGWTVTLPTAPLKPLIRRPKATPVPRPR